MKNGVSILWLAALLALGACNKKAAPAALHKESVQAGAVEAKKSEARKPDSANEVQITPEAAKEAGIDTVPAGPALLHEVLPLYGLIQPNAERMRAVSARYPGVVQAVTKRVGDAVRSGEVLARVESNESLQTYSVTAPIAGIVTARDVNPGETVAEKALFTVADLSTVWVELSLFPNDLSRVRVGQNVRVKSVDGGLSGAGRLVWVSVLGTSESQSVTARVLLENRNHQWTPGLYVSGEVILSEATVPLAVRTSAVQSVDGQSVVFVRNARGYEVRPVKLGRQDSEVIEVLDGLRAGEPYVVTGSFLVKAELGKAGAKDED
jgi:cobalt-zinc-cadmium efflux system membrane fusion protein